MLRSGRKGDARAMNDSGVIGPRGVERMGKAEGGDGDKGG